MFQRFPFARSIVIGFVYVCAANITTGQQAAQLPPLEIEEKPQSIQRLLTRTTHDADRAQSLALFGQGRVLFQREQYAEALRAYQRAYHWNPDSKVILNEIVGLAFYLKEFGPATRYAVIAAEQGVALGEAGLSRQLAQYLIQTDDIERALGLYEQAIRQLEGESLDAEFVNVHMEAARVCYVLDKYEQGARSFEYVVDAISHPDRYGLTEEERDALVSDPDVFLMIGETFLRAGQFGKARKMLDRVQATSPQEPILPYLYAELAFQTNQTEDALQALDRYFRAKSTTADQLPYQLLEKLLADEQQFTERLEKLHRADVKNSAIIRCLATQYEEHGNPSAALQTYQKLFDLPATFADYEALVRVATKQTELEPILQVLGRLVAQTGNIDFLQKERKRLAGNEEMTAALIKRVLQQTTPNEEQAEQILGVGLLALYGKQFDQAQECLELATSGVDKERARDWTIGWGLELFLENENERAAAIFEQVLKSGPPEDASGLRYYLATALEMSHQTEQAISQIDKAIADQPQSLLLLNRKGWILYHAKKFDEAKELFEQTVAKFDDDDGAEEYVKEARFSLSNISLEQKLVPEAIEWLEQILDDYPEDVGALNDLGYLFADENQHLQRALRMVQMAVRKEPENTAYLDSLGWAMHRLGRHDEALRHIERAVDEDDPDGIVLDHLGDIYLALERKGDAIRTWQRAVRLLTDRDQTELRNQVAAKIARHQSN